MDKLRQVLQDIQIGRTHCKNKKNEQIEQGYQQLLNCISSAFAAFNEHGKLKEIKLKVSIQKSDIQITAICVDFRINEGADYLCDIMDKLLQTIKIEKLENAITCEMTSESEYMITILKDFELDEPSPTE